MKLRFSTEATAHIANIHSHISEHNPRAATAVVERIFAATELLREFPHIGREGRDSGTREWVVPGSALHHRLRADVSGPSELMVMAVFHGARQL